MKVYDRTRGEAPLADDDRRPDCNAASTVHTALPTSHPIYCT
jgi:hypothetical protein